MAASETDNASEEILNQSNLPAASKPADIGWACLQRADRVVQIIESVIHLGSFHFTHHKLIP
jgi:hypothetical protein